MEPERDHLEAIEQILGHTFSDPSLLNQALTHPSVTHEQGTLVKDNQRLEFLGDAVLQLILTTFLYREFPEVSEGPLTKARAQLVNRRALAEHAKRLDLGRFLILSRGEELNQGRQRASTLADAFEAVLAALFLDGGFDVAQRFVLNQFGETFGDLKVLPNLENPKGELQEILQAHSPEPVEYRLESVSGPDHDRVFECSVIYRGASLGRGSGKSKKEAESRAAMQALESIRESEGGVPGNRT